eukprot:TRINITY_DN2710_c0_g1_i1.p1 TRINITY_DN2710_c0_g1~~TRINITY_DN2710_c0_g1_i1.p1  ORF type:complete len:615 (-),score=204.72 TRINITY_DN2710_c0_g1_i1:16-1860(-)
MASTKKLRITVASGRNLVAKNGTKSDPYCEIVVLDDQGNKVGKSQTTKVIKGDLNPPWGHILEFSVGSTFSGIKLRVWDKRKFRGDKFMGQVTVKFNTEVMQSTSAIDDWFPLSKRKTKENVSGDVHLQIQYGDLVGAPTKDRSATISDFQAPSTQEVRASVAFNTDETNAKLKSTTHVIVEEDPAEDSSIQEINTEYDKIRDGPAQAAMEKAIKDEKDITFGTKNLELSNNSNNYTTAFAKGNVKVNSGKWYFEVRIVNSGVIQVGWCTLNYNPKVTATSEHSWSYEISRQEKKKDANSEKYGQYCNTGDIIGCLIDVDAKIISFSHNGKDLGTAFTTDNDIVGRICPLVGIGRRAKVVVNFGKDGYAFPVEGYNMIHSFLTDKEIDSLFKLFCKYRDVGNTQLLEDRKQEILAEKGKQELQVENSSLQVEVDVELKDTIHGTGLLEFQKHIGIVDDDDIMVLAIPWKMKCGKVWEISKEEFMNTWTITGCSTLEKMKSKVKEWREDLKKEIEFKQFYNFVFDYLKEDKKILTLDEALTAWSLIMKDKKWPMFGDFQEFLTEDHKKAISRDVWQQLWHFMKAHPLNLKEHDPMSSWPIVFDEFVEWMEKVGRK